MAPRVDQVASSQSLPAAAEVVVIGAGIVGSSAALFLARAGIPVVLCEKGQVAGEQSSRNWGWCRAMGRDFREIPLILESLRLWRAMNEMAEAETGFRTAGTLFLSDDEAELKKYESWLGHARDHQIDSRLISSGEVATLLPGFTRRFAGALYTPSDGRAEPQLAAPAIARAVQRHGGTVMTGCAVRSVETLAGRVCGVVTERGPIACQAVVLAGGAWSRLFCGNLGIGLPQLKVLGSVLRTQPQTGGPEVSLVGSDFALRKRLDGGYTAACGRMSTAEITPDSLRLFADYLPALRREWGNVRPRIGRRFFTELATPRRWQPDRITPFERVRVLDPAPNHALLAKAMAALRSAHPAFRETKVAESWGGFIDVTPDVVPVISEVGALPGFFIATGFSGHGFGIGPGAGRLTVDLVTGRRPIVDPSPFRLSRFSDGSKLVLDAGL
jgi:glycine/D-amino acid oxidase-like deaminating enzyme